MLQNFKAAVAKVFFSLLNTRAAVVYMLLFAAAIGTATFIENDFGTSAAQKVVYQAGWFELLLALFGGSIVYNIVQYRFIQRKKWSLLLFHGAIIIIILGAGITRYYGYEGVMGIREGSTSNRFYSARTYMHLQFQNEQGTFEKYEPVLFASLGQNEFEKSYKVGRQTIAVKLQEFIPNPRQQVVDKGQGKPTLKVVMAGASGRNEYLIKQGEQKFFQGQAFNFSASPVSGAINLSYQNGQLYIKAFEPLFQMVMATRQRDTLLPRAEPYPLQLRSLYRTEEQQFVFAEFNESATTQWAPGQRKIERSSKVGLTMQVSANGEEQTQTIIGQKGLPGKSQTFLLAGTQVNLSYGARILELPFRLKLHDFEMTRYPGTNSPASFASEVQLIDPSKGLNKDFRIYMNHILTHRGYRFFQSSFDKDEKGTYLSVNHDFWGTWVSYLGYALLTLGFIMLLFSKNTRFYSLRQKVKQLQNTPTILILLVTLLGSTALHAQANLSQAVTVPSEAHAEKFSRVIVQDIQGRMKPMHTLSREAMRKLHGTESYRSYNADQLMLSMYANPSQWYSVPFIKVGRHEKLRNMLGIEGKYAAYKDFFNKDGSYRFSNEVKKASTKAPIDKDNFDKELIKLDERVNIMNMVYSGSLLKVIPIPQDPNNTWVANRTSHLKQAVETEVAEKFFSQYKKALYQALQSGNFQTPNAIVEALKEYQQEHGSAVLPSARKVSLEIVLNKLKVFHRLALFYTMLGFLFLGLLFFSVLKKNARYAMFFKVLVSLLLLGFAFHTLGLGLRWYISGRAPWSNGYESMIYIAWTTTLAGIIFTRKSPGGLAATNILAGVILLIAMLSYLNPEITPLVPVLKSYWLTIHVSLVAGSYGFLMLGAIIGLINLLLMVFVSEANKKIIKTKIKELSYLSELTITGGLIMLSIGTYLAGVWANESWGRYWGWDAKETWALVSILVYAFILHMRLIPRLMGLYAFNLATLFGLASVIMTYFGVNYYLSGLHSYAAGDPVPIPQWVYLGTAALVVISILAYWRSRKVHL